MANLRSLLEPPSLLTPHQLLIVFYFSNFGNYSATVQEFADYLLEDSLTVNNLELQRAFDTLTDWGVLVYNPSNKKFSKPA